MRFVLLFLLATAAAFAANVRLYLKDGDFHIVREYEVKDDRVRFYSVDRRDWEEIPLDLIDLKRTEKEAEETAKAKAEVVKEQMAEDAAIAADKKLVLSVPDEPGVYRVEGQTLSTLPEATVFKKDSNTNKILQIVISAPIVPGKTTVFIKEKASKYRLTDPNPEFFFRLAKQERLAIVKLNVKKDDRIVEDAMILPQEEGIEEDLKEVPAFKKQYDVNLYRLWPEMALEPGEYAVVEYTEGAIAVRVWDFAVDKKK
jgi:hypothetical protein